jgi:hypothetical protein
MHKSDRRVGERQTVCESERRDGRSTASPQTTGGKMAGFRSALYDAFMNDSSNQSRFHIAPRHIFCASAGSHAPCAAKVEAPFHIWQAANV